MSCSAEVPAYWGHDHFLGSTSGKRGIMESTADFSSEPLPPTEEPTPSTAVEESAQDSVQPPGILRTSSAAVVASEVPLAEVERALVELLGCYKGALKFAVDMPVFGRCAVSGARFRWRWGARFYTRLYVETHVRKHLQAIRSRLRLELLGTTEPKDRDQVMALEADLAGQVEPLLGWRRILGVITRLPPVAAVLPLLSAVAASTVSGEISWKSFWHAVVVLVATAVVVWVLVVWPSIRLGFRIKRAIFCGGRDLSHPFYNVPGELQWNGFAAAKVYDDPGKLWVDLFRELTDRKQQQTPRQAFPTSNVYQAENDLYHALGRRKPGEVPIDMLLGFTPYLWCAFSALVVLLMVQTVTSGNVPTSFWFFLPWLALLSLAPFQAVLQGVRNYRFRSH
jgi:hypothetical protein